MNQPTAAPRWVHFGTLCAIALVLLGAGALAGCSRSRSASPQAGASGQAASETAQADAKALDSLGKRSWFDPATGEYRTPRPSQEIDHPLRRTGTFAGPRNTTPTTGGGGGGGGGWRLPSGEMVGYFILIVLGTALLGVAIALAVASLRSWLPSNRLTVLKQNAIAIDPARVADLPFEAQVEMQDPLAYAKHLIAQGNLDEAVIFIYGYMLLALDRAGKIALHRGKTNRMYLQELFGDVELRNMLTPAMLAFEDVFFGRHAIERERFRKIWNTLDAFHRELAGSIAAAPPIEEGVVS